MGKLIAEQESKMKKQIKIMYHINEVSIQKDEKAWWVEVRGITPQGFLVTIIIPFGGKSTATYYANMLIEGEDTDDSV